MITVEKKVTKDEIKAPNNNRLEFLVRKKLPGNLDIPSGKILRLIKSVDFSAFKEEMMNEFTIKQFEKGDSYNGFELYSHPDDSMRETIQYIFDNGYAPYIIEYGDDEYLQLYHRKKAEPIQENKVPEVANNHYKDILQERFADELALDIRDKIINREAKTSNYYKITTDATDDSKPADGVPDIPKDDSSPATIKIQKYSASDNELTGDTHDETVYLKTDRGILDNLSIDLANGYGETALHANGETVIANVEVYHPKYEVSGDEIKIQFI